MEVATVELVDMEMEEAVDVVRDLAAVMEAVVDMEEVVAVVSAVDIAVVAVAEAVKVVMAMAEVAMEEVALEEEEMVVVTVHARVEKVVQERLHQLVPLHLLLVAVAMVNKCCL